MKILLIVDCYLPGTKSSARMIYDLAAEFLRTGHTTIVLCPDDSLDTPARLASEDGIQVLRIKAGPVKDIPKPLRAFNESRLSAILWQKGKKFFLENPCDLIVYYSPTIFFGPLVARLKNLWQCKSYMVLRDIFPQWAVDAGLLKKGLAWRFFRRAEIQAYKAADVIAVQSPANLDYFRQNNFDSHFTLDVLYNWTSPSNNLPARDDRRRLGLQDKFVFFYGGNIGLAQDMDNIIRLACNLKSRQDIHFLLTGDGSEVPHVKDKIARLGLANITLHPAVPQNQYHAMVKQFDAGLISLRADLKTHNFPGKLLSYISAGLPILASINPGNDLAGIIERSRAGLACINGQDDLFFSHALALADDPCLRRTMGQNAKALLDSTFSTASAASQILSRFR